MNENLNSAKYLATLVLQLTSLAELFLKDYEAELYKAGFESKQAAKMRIKQNAELAKKLRLNLKSIELDLTGKCSEEQEDAFLDDVGFLHNLILKAYSVAGERDNRRKRILKTMDNLYPKKMLSLEK